jgi:DNA-binding response OmpR family regulator
MAEQILIVDDDVDSLKLIGLMLQRHGYKVLAANAGNQALAKAEAEVPDLIILDVMMPDMNGLEVCRRLRDNPTTSEIPIIMFTAKTLIDDKVKGFEAGADDYLTKPTHPAELASRVKAILARNAAQKSSQAGGKQSGKIIGVMGAKGGTGTTTVALNLAAALMKKGQNTLLTDLRPGNGSLSLMLGLPGGSLEEVLSEDAVTPPTITNHLQTHESGLRSLLAAPGQNNRLQLSVDHITALMQGLRRLADPAVVDMGTGLTVWSHAALSEVDRILLVLEPNNVALQMAQVRLKELENHLDDNRVSIVVVNRVKSSLQTPWPEIENRLGRDVQAIISVAPEVAFKAMEARTAMVLHQPAEVVSGQFSKLAEDMKSGIRSIAKP